MTTFFRRNRQILRIVGFQLVLLALMAGIIVIGFSFYESDINKSRIQEVLNPIAVELEEELFVLSQLSGVKEPHSAHNFIKFQNKLNSSNISATSKITFCSDSEIYDFKFQILKSPSLCIFVQTTNEHLSLYFYAFSIAFLLLIVFSLPMYKYFLKEASSRATLEAKSELADKVVHGVGSPLARFELLLEDIKGKLESSDYKFLQSIYDDFRYQFLKLSFNDYSTNKERRNVDLFSIASLTSYNKIKEFENDNKKVDIIFDQNNKKGLFSYVNPKVVEEALDNIINNAYDAISYTGEICIKICQSNNVGIIQVSDNGKGIPSDKLEAIFDKGFSTKKKTPKSGMGMGLYQARKELAENGASIKATSTHGKGTTISITFQLCKPPVWYVNELDLKDFDNVVLIDDQIGMNDIDPLSKQLKARLKALNIGFIGLESKESLEKYLCDKKSSEKNFYLVDLEYQNEDYTGIDIIAKFNLENSAIFTSVSYSSEAYQKCEDLKIKLIRKHQINSFNFFNSSLQNNKDKVKVVMVDNDKFLLKAAKNILEKRGFLFIDYDSPRKLIDDLCCIDKDSIILYDHDFGNGEITGEELLNILIENKFRQDRVVLISALADKLIQKYKTKTLAASKHNFQNIIDVVSEMSQGHVIQ